MKIKLIYSFVLIFLLSTLLSGCIAFPSSNTASKSDIQKAKNYKPPFLSNDKYSVLYLNNPYRGIAVIGIGGAAAFGQAKYYATLKNIKTGVEKVINYPSCTKLVAGKYELQLKAAEVDMKPENIVHEIKINPNTVRYLGLRSSSGWWSDTNTHVVDEPKLSGQFYTKQNPPNHCPHYNDLRLLYAKNVTMQLHLSVLNATKSNARVKFTAHGVFKVVPPGETGKYIYDAKKFTGVNPHHFFGYAVGHVFVEASNARKYSAIMGADNTKTRFLNVDVLSKGPNDFGLSKGECFPKYSGTKAFTNKIDIYCKTKLSKP